MSSIDEIKRRNELHETLINAEKSNQLLKAIGKQAMAGGAIYARLFHDLEMHHQTMDRKAKGRVQSSSSTSREDPRLRQSLRQEPSAREMKTYRPCPVLMRPLHIHQVVGRGGEMRVNLGSGHEWLPEELAKITEIFHTIEKPKYADRQHWDLYYDSFAKRFLAHYPGRSKWEVMQRVGDMIRTKRLKIPGEKEYWDQLSRQIQMTT